MMILAERLVLKVADPDFELRRVPGSILLALTASLHSVISSFFTQNKGWGRGRAPQDPPLDPSLVKFVISHWSVSIRLC